MRPMKNDLGRMCLCVFFLLLLTPLRAESDNKIFATLLPEPQKFELIAGEHSLLPQNITGFYLDKKAKIPFGQSYFPNKLEAAPGKNIVSLRIDKKVKHKEGYRLSVRNGEPVITASTQVGLLYGVQTLIQLAQNATELQLPLPGFEMEDQPNSDYRAIHIDLKHHLDKMDYMYKVLDRMAYYKLNAAIVEFEDKLRYESYPTIASPNAYTIAEWKKWSEYAHQLNIEISPLIQGIGHADFILKHDEFKKLREVASSDWVCCPSSEEYYRVQFGLYDDAIAATPYGKYVHVGGDEVGDIAMCPACKAKNITPLQLQLEWLKKVSDHVISKGRKPIFWDDMLFKHTGLIEYIQDHEKPELMDSIWEANLPRLNKHLDNFPKKVIYMRWLYGNADQKGNKMALKWYRDNHLPVMGATSAQTTFAMMPSGSIPNNIRSFQMATQDAPIGVLCTAWDDASPLSDTYWKGFIAQAQYCWNIATPMDQDQFSQRYRVREFGNTIAALPDFRKQLEATFPLWETGLLDEGLRRSVWRTNGKYKIMSLPNDEPGSWTKKYEKRIEEAKKNSLENLKLAYLIRDYRRLATRNDYSLQVFERINDLTGYTPKLLLALSAYDVERDPSSLNNLRACIYEFKQVRANMEEVYGQIRYLNQPEGYILPMNHHAHIAIVSANTDWMFMFELGLIDQLERSDLLKQKD